MHAQKNRPLPASLDGWERTISFGLDFPGGGAGTYSASARITSSRQGMEGTAPSRVTARFKEQPMARTTNAEKALALMKKPADADFTIRIEDDFLPENSGVYHVTAGGVERTEAEADLSVDQRTFTLLALGALSMEEAAYRSDVKISANRAMLSRVFVRKPLFIADYF